MTLRISALILWRESYICAGQLSKALAMTSLLSLNSPLPMHRWHKMLTFIGLALLAISLIFSPTWLPSHQVGLLGLGFMLYGLGDWKRIRTRLKGELRPDWIGLGMLVTGGIFVLWSLAAVVRVVLGF